MTKTDFLGPGWARIAHTAETLQLDLWLELSSIRNRVKDRLGPEGDRDWARIRRPGWI